MVAPWFQSLAEKMDFDRIPKSTQEIFRSFMMDFVAKNIPLKTDNTATVALKNTKLAGLAVLAKIKK